MMNCPKCGKRIEQDGDRSVIVIDTISIHVICEDAEGCGYDAYAVFKVDHYIDEDGRRCI